MQIDISKINYSLNQKELKANFESMGQWMGRAVTWFKGVMQDKRFVYPTLVLTQAALLYTIWTILTFVNERISDDNLSKTQKNIKCYGLLASYAASYALISSSLIYAFSHIVNSKVSAVISAVVFVVETYFINEYSQV